MAHCRIFVDSDLHEHERLIIPDDQTHYLRQVMRQKNGDQITVFNGRGGEYTASIEDGTRQNCSCMLDSFHDISRELSLPVHIIQSANRSEKIDVVLQKGTELGAASFCITESERSALRLSGAKLEKRLQRWKKIIIEAAEQSGRTSVPDIFWQSSLQSLPQRGLCFALHPSEVTTWQCQRQNITEASEISLAIGPEGGWSPAELINLTAIGFQPMQFGGRILRTETAAPALLAAIQAIL
ncbi:MAG: 16S rRNA (uracil(1498)-N(3))-methyltransferase [Zetaproteobacteria bacterium CG_4_9_14_3_um_filter_49_83]|nr:MAG: hypothetical protein AUJ56_13325 [Zetaproteobacteria bacterium CG1_02_49_23]PIQ30544.1 MAG: 16S rRNA (uracil(1498)-N(3))-methyltransferase [Zetaproteobacteria bacterium CG17_big_fil_post_rev_8_21_14_2_50_50_13]PIV30975.1 MAG: 16S rRNA (uracil(1498)-N(3))-methyltransferase [Zetaproteobacteria bacterium CG02_land_8_20_14_3_00_50_9]PIY54914.1 MAG: 16S rRNA (uracil(1498)-N(3))-methyltransferase [Zetaproteobacteria bacterium CG_4_10_14_0_8_um_filter_49_80]PJA35591.1 MAG: 16S rRNA (uracil(149